MAKQRKKQTTPAPAATMATTGESALEDFRWQGVLLCLLVLIAFGNSTTGSFHFDDYAILVDGYITNHATGLQIFRLGQTRPLTYLTFHWNYLMGGDDPAGFHWVNLFLHMADCVLMLALARRYLSPWIAGCVAVVFAVHPLQTEAVSYVYARSSLLSTLFALLAMIYFARGRWVRSAILFGVSLLAKEETIALPGFFVMLDLFERHRSEEGRRAPWWYYAMLAVLGAAAAGRLFYLIKVTPAAGVGFAVKGVPTLDYLLTQGRVMWIYLRLFVLPWGLNLDHDIMLSTSLLNPWTTLAAWLALLALGAWLLWEAWRKQPAAVWALGFFVLISPSSSIVAQADLIFEHRTYLPIVALLIALGYVLERVPRPRLNAAFAVLIPVMIVGTMFRNTDWYTERSLWTDIIAKSPHKSRAYLGLAKTYLGVDDTKVRELLRTGLEMDPNNAEIHTNLGVSLMAAQQPAEALGHFRQAMALTRETADGWNNIGAAYYAMGDLRQSLASYQRALEKDPCNYNARHNSVMLYASQNQKDAAFRVGEVPSGCHLIPTQADELDKYRRQVSAPMPGKQPGI